MREIEIKLPAPDLSKVETTLQSLGATIGTAITQEDFNFVHCDDTKWFGGEIKGFSYPRIRKQGDNSLKLTVKRPLLNQMDCLEYETTIGSREEVEGMLKLFGYVSGTIVKKTRKVVEYNGYTITLDDVEGLGSFVEIERVVDDGDAEQIQKEMITFATDILGLTYNVETMKGYDVMMYLKTHSV